VKLLLDMNLSPTWVPFLAQAGVDAVHWSRIGAATAPDREVMAWARANDCIVFTNDLDFSALLAMTRETGPSVLQVRLPDLRPSSIGPFVVSALRDHEDALHQGAIVTITEGGMRARVLPLRS